MTSVLTLLDAARWQGTAVVGERQQTVLAVLAEAGPAGGSDIRLEAMLWPGPAPFTVPPPRYQRGISPLSAHLRATGDTVGTPMRSPVGSSVADGLW